MKIYHKRNFLSGLFYTLLAITLITLNIVQEFKIKTFIISILGLLFGIRTIIGSMSRELTKKDIIDELDERNQLINLKSSSKSFRLTQNINFVIMIIFFIAAKIYNSDMLFYITFGLTFSYAISLVTEIFTTIYYEHRI
ncbi:hypothetical protein [Defluviitalea phaphyphila]|uniref:hypothetical protein n=1 Tax=Defluviitalea phaphyphila TaxID=1473580 RepID=UPI000731AE09|nr:hypothetical protein [Defluviitalea phaphyphila]